MPFINFSARPFTLRSINQNAPPQSGVYGICSPSEWVVVGEAENIREVLLQYLGQPNSTVGGRRPTGFTFELCEGNARMARKRTLIMELHPTCNPSGNSASNSDASMGASR